jgi:glycosyltransferase involved in cell wall biosynthesis
MSMSQRDSAPRAVLIVSPHFPPSTLAGVHRARHLAKHLPAHGWRPTVIRVDERHYAEAGDPALADLVPPSVEQVRTGAVSARLARLVGIGDISLRAYRSIAEAIAASVKRDKPDAVLISGAPFYPMLLARNIRLRWKVPVILDFQDPWVSADGAQRRYWSKGRMAHRLACALEPRALRWASWVTSVSAKQNADLAARSSWLRHDRMSAIPIGGDPTDFDALRASPPENPAVSLDPGLLNLCYVGTFLPHAGPTVRALFQAVAEVRKRRPDLAARLRLVFVGTSNQPPGTVSGSHRVTAIAEEAGIANLVVEHPARVPFIEALSLLANARGLLMLGSNEPHYTASKIYPALMSGKPFLSIYHQLSSSHEILSRAGGGASLAFADVSCLPDLVPAIGDAIERLVEKPESFGHSDPRAYAAYTAHSVAGKFAEVFKEAAKP